MDNTKLDLNLKHAHFILLDSSTDQPKWISVNNTTINEEGTYESLSDYE